MKKIVITTLLILSILFMLAGCGEKTKNDMGSDIQSSIDSAEDRLNGSMDSSGNGMTGSNNGTSGLGNGINNSNNNMSNANGTTADISKDEAKKIAFKHAGINESDSFDIEADFENDDGTAEYEISFETKSNEYDYHINAKTGEIISSSKEAKNSNNR